MSEYRWLNDISQQFLNKTYLLPGQTVDERVDIICNRAEEVLDKKGFAEKFKSYFKKGWYSFSTPVWTNYGTDRGLNISCFGSHIEDSMESILGTASEVGMMTKHGGGTSAYFGELRERGASIKNNGESSGAVHFMKLFETNMSIVSQGNTRRGSFAAYLPIDHPDVVEFLNIRTDGSPIQNLSFGIVIPDYWMKEMVNGDKKKRKVWLRVLEARANTGYPYILFKDTVNNNTVDVYKDKNMTINASNLCVTGDQRVVSDRGLKTVKELYEDGGDLVLFDGEKKVNSSPMKLIEKNAKVYKVTLENGMSHTITDYHKVVVAEKNKWLRDCEIKKECKHLKIGDRVSIQTKKGIFGKKDMTKEAFLLGLYQSDGTQHKDIIMIDIWENDFDLEDEIQSSFDYVHYGYGCDTYNTYNTSGAVIAKRKIKSPKFYNCSIPSNSSVKKKRLASKTLNKALSFKKGIVPEWIWESNEETQWSYLRGLLYADGTAFVSKGNGSPIQIAYSDTNIDFLKQLQLIYANLGLQSSIRVLHEAGLRKLPDGRGGHKEYNCKKIYRLIVGNKNDALEIEKNTGFLSRKNIKLENREYRDNTKKYYAISSIEYCGEEDVYCCTVDSEEHLWVCNGFVTSNCSEILLPTSEEESFVCCLSSMNLLYYDEWKDTDAVETMVYFLDTVLTEFIKRAKDIKYMERAVRFSERHRAIGLGVFGWHSYLQENMIPFESMRAKMVNVQISKKIKEQAYAASEKMAKEYGEPELLKGYGRRHATLMAVAPTKSSSAIIGQASEGIEPHTANYYIKDLQNLKFSMKNPQLERLLKTKDKNTLEIWNSILEKGGSVQHLDFLTKEEKDVFKTFSEISQKEVLIQAAQRQKYIDQGQSLNLMIHPSIPVEDINKLMIEAWMMGIKTLYYQKSVNAAQQFSRNILHCESCE